MSWLAARVALTLALECGVAACQPASPTTGGPAEPVAAVGTSDEGGGAPVARSFGEQVDPTLETTELRAMLQAPDRFDGRRIKTEGLVSQVCQRAGCWMELRVDQAGQPVRVPMAGHSFFLPRDVVGRRATVEGQVEVRRLDQATIDHLRSEGAEAAEQSLGIVATAVLVH